jgi:hypothetical protein
MTLHPQLWWWIARSTGIVAWASATAAVAWGLVVSGRLVRRRRLPAWLLDLHRYLGTLTLAFVVLHLAALAADGYTHFGARELLVPMASTWRPRAVTWGIVALYGLVVIQVTSWGMRFLPRRVWHGIHCSSFLVFVAATVHGALAGADRDNPLVQALAVAGTTLVVTLVLLRMLTARADEKPPSGRTGDRAARLAAARAVVTATPDPFDVSTACPPSAADRLPDPAPAPVVVAVAEPAVEPGPDGSCRQDRWARSTGSAYST